MKVIVIVTVIDSQVITVIVIVIVIDNYTSGPVERLFSIGGKFFRPERCRLSDSVFEKLMNIKCNGHLV